MKKTSKTGIILVASMLVCVLLALAVGIPNGFFGDGGKSGDLDDDNTPGMEEIIDGGSPLLVFDKSEDASKLMTAFDKGQIVLVRLLHDQSGANSEVQSDEQAVIREAYKGLKNIVVGELSNKSVTDSYHHVVFVLEDGSEIGYYFEGDDLLCYEGSGSAEKGNYEVSGTSQLWDVYKKLAEK